MHVGERECGDNYPCLQFGPDFPVPAKRYYPVHYRDNRDSVVIGVCRCVAEGMMGVRVGGLW